MNKPFKTKSMNKKIIAANWKMNLLQDEATNLAQSLVKFTEENPKISKNAKIIICPNFTILSLVKNILQNSSIKIGAQDCHFENKGAFTGSVSPEILADIGTDYVILGHSERRTLNDETSELVAKKAAKAHENGLKTIICVGETREEKESGGTNIAIKSQISQSIPSSSTTENTIIAYEPVWAIGTGKTPTILEIEGIHQLIKQEATKNFSNFYNSAPQIIYGGSAKSSNSKELLANEFIDGLLVGSASLKLEEFCSMVEG